jgi:hypothetical protein
LCADVIPFALTDTAVVSVVGIVVSGIAGPWAVARWARTRQKADHRHERRQKRYDDLVALLDSAAEILAPGASRLRAASDGATDSADLVEWSSQVHVTYERLLLRLRADDPVSEAYLSARQHLVGVAGALEKPVSDVELDDAVDQFEAARSNYLGVLPTDVVNAADRRPATK